MLAAQGITPRRLMSDNAWSYTHNRTLRELLQARGIRHLTTKPYRPRTNGKVERFIQTLEREWAYGLVYGSSEHRRRALPHWLHHYNRAADPTAHSEADPRSAAFRTSVGRTASVGTGARSTTTRHAARAAGRRPV